ncbi:hypothetical protein ACFW9G_32805, partial [Streptomyces anandii]
MSDGTSSQSWPGEAAGRQDIVATTVDRGGPRTVWSRDFALFFVARAVARLGDTMLPVALAAGLLQHGYGAGAVGLAMASTAAAFAGLVVFGGVPLCPSSSELWGSGFVEGSVAEHGEQDAD